jgi:hypothetical protein
MGVAAALAVAAVKVAAPERVGAVEVVRARNPPTQV